MLDRQMGKLAGLLHEKCVVQYDDGFGALARHGGEGLRITFNVRALHFEDCDSQVLA